MWLLVIILSTSKYLVYGEEHLVTAVYHTRASHLSHHQYHGIVITRYILIHLPSYGDKLEYILFMLRKLYSFAAGDCGVDNADSLQNQELLLPGHLMCTFVKEKFDETLDNIRVGLLKEMRVDYTKFLSNAPQAKWWTKMVDRYGMLSSGGIGKKVSHFLSTGNIISTTGLDLMQVSGYTIVAEKLNFLRFCAHFRSVHRGQFFMEMKTTAVRKLLPDQWGFLCPGVCIISVLVSVNFRGLLTNVIVVESYQILIALFIQCIHPMVVLVVY